MSDWKRMIPGITGASLALGGAGCDGGSTPTASDVLTAGCQQEKTCDPTEFAYDYASVTECVQVRTSDWTEYAAPTLQELGGKACENAYLAALDCYYDHLTTCATDQGAAVSACAGKFDAAADKCSNVDGHGGEIQALAEARCADYMACEPTYFAEEYGSLSACVSWYRIDLASELLEAKSDGSACVNAEIKYAQCYSSAYKAPACDYYDAYYACGAQASAVNTACPSKSLDTSGSMNRNRSPEDAHRPRWMRHAR